MYRIKHNLLLLICLLLVTAQVGLAAQVQVDFLDVGQGDAVLIHSRDGGVLLIDAGIQSAGAAVVVPHIKRLGIEDIDAVVMTHPHSDHIGGLIPVLEQIPVARVYSNYQVHTTQLYERLLLLIESLDIPFLLAEPGTEIPIAGIDRIEVLHPSQPLSDQINNNSIVLRMEVDGVSFLFTGDIEKEAEQLLINKRAELAADIIKVPHHGSSTSSHHEFVAAVQPSTAVIMVGEGNRYGHPDLEVLVRYQAAGAEIYRTDHHGTITVRVEDGVVSIETAKSRVGADQRLNLNSATLEELQTVPGIGPVLAARIITYREEFGFDSVEDLINITGIGAKTLEQIRDYFYVY